VRPECAAGGSGCYAKDQPPSDVWGDERYEHDGRAFIGARECPIEPHVFISFSAGSAIIEALSASASSGLTKTQFDLHVASHMIASTRNVA
jgi:hypothetical protein